jgi:methionyl-tRNA formyltransferase
MKKKILFFGTPEIAVPSLKAIAALEDYEIVGVGVFPDRKVGRKQILTPCPVKAAALELELPVFEIDSKAELKALFQAVPCDLAIVIAFGLIFPPSVLRTPPLGVVNVHFSLLPEHRGASPVQAAILKGQTQTGITWQRMVKALDAGDILWQTTHDIHNQNTRQVWEDFSHFTAEAFPAFLNAYTQAQITPQVQNENEATFCGKYEKSDGYLDYRTQDAATIYNAWLAFTPWPGVSFNTTLGQMKLLEISLEALADSVPITCANDTTLWIKTAQIPGKGPQPFSALLNRETNLLI